MRHPAPGRSSALRDLAFLTTLLLGAPPLGAVPAAPGTAVTLEGLLSFPFPSSVVAAAEADRLAWVVNDRGVRNLWTAATPDWRPSPLTRYDADDGQTLSGLALTPDGSLLVYTRGGGPDRAGDAPNPTSDPAGAEQAVWVVPTDGHGEPRRLGAGHAPVVSPSGDRVLFLDKGKIYQVPLAPAAAAPSPEGARPEEAGEAAKASKAQPEELFGARGQVSRPRYSPDGSRVAFVSDRGDHGFVGIYDPAAGSITWIAPSVDRDGFAAWSPDGTRVSFLRSPGREKHEVLDITGGVPFSIWVGDAATGEARELWRSPGDDGGFSQYYPPEPLRWTAGGRLLFTSEHEGWFHVYSLPASGGTPVDLTPGACEAEKSAVSQDGATLFFAANCGDLDRRHLWRVSTAGGTPQPLTSGDGLETDPVPLASGRFLAYRGATARRPPAVTFASLGANGAVDGAPRLLSPAQLPGSFPPESALVVPRPVLLHASDGLEIHAQLFLPRGARPGDHRPAVLFFHGGPIRQMLLGWHDRGYYADAYAMNQYLASRGYLVLAVNYRSGIGYGRDFRRAPGQGPRGATEYRDVLAAGLYLRRRPEVDADRIGLWGGSYGGYLTAMGLARNSDLFAAGVDLHGVHDWSFRATDFLPGGAWGLSGEDMLAEALRSSPEADLSTWSSPVLLIHGDDDRNVLFQQTTDLVQRLRQRKVDVETLVFPDEVHGFLLHRSWLRAYRAAAGFFERFLKGK